jgi:AcrR family transcriptional regulator
MKKTENKYFYTAKLMQQALLLLLEIKDIEYISVTDVVKRAGVSRSTFYLHYENLYELLEETIEALHKDFILAFQKKEENINIKHTPCLITEEQLIPYLEFCKRNKRALRLIHQKPHLFAVEKTYRNMYDSIFYPAISQYLEDETDRTYHLEFYTQGVTGIIRKWMELDCETEIDRLVEIIKGCTGR